MREAQIVANISDRQIHRMLDHLAGEFANFEREHLGNLSCGHTSSM
jgi:hypothetical protein